MEIKDETLCVLRSCQGGFCDRRYLCSRFSFQDVIATVGVCLTALSPLDIKLGVAAVVILVVVPTFFFYPFFLGSRSQLNGNEDRLWEED